MIRKYKASIEKIIEVVSHKLTHGIEETEKVFNIKRESILRYEREYDMLLKNNALGKQDNLKIMDSTNKGKRLLKVEKLLEKLSDKELDSIVKSVANTHDVDYKNKPTKIDFEGKTLKYGYLGDTHLGSIYTPEERIFAAMEVFKKEDVEFVLHGGDVTEGMSNRPGHIYELVDIGYSAQKKKSIDIFSQWTDTPIYAIDGNHDRWFIKSNGAYIVPDICENISNMHFLGHDEGDLILDNGCRIKLWHGEDGSSYAISYRVQKVIESLQGGDKPDIMHLAHTHKFCYLFERNIHAVSGGCIQNQSKWMRGKRLSAHTCFQVIEVTFNKTGVAQFIVKNYPFYF